jgi:uncharacterized surface protein with fasciclin (FAS1) repeats
MKKALTIIQISVGLFFIANTSKAQEVVKPIEAIPEAVLQKRTEPSYTAPTPSQNNEAIKATIALQAKAQAKAKTEQKNNTATPKEEIPQPVIVPTDAAMQSLPATTIDTKLNTDKYYNHKPIIPVESLPEQVSKPVVKPKANQKPVIAVVE